MCTSGGKIWMVQKLDAPTYNHLSSRATSRRVALCYIDGALREWQGYL
jgi:hypothetical protein